MPRALFLLVQTLLLIVQPRVCTCAAGPEQCPARLAVCVRPDLHTGCADGHHHPESETSENGPPVESGPNPTGHAPDCRALQPSTVLKQAERLSEFQVVALNAVPLPTLGWDEPDLALTAAQVFEPPLKSSRPLFLTLRTLVI